MLQYLSQLNISRTAIEDYFIDISLTWGSRIFKGILIILLARLALRFGQNVIARLLTPGQHKPSILPEGKAKTLLGLLFSLWHYIVYSFAILLLLSNLEINIGPILAGAGIVGLAVGFGAQNLVRDVISGFFLILEDQFTIGEYVTVLEYSGTVEEIGLRITKIRGWDGELYIIPNGLIASVTNWNRGHMRALVEVGVAYEEDLDRVLTLLEQVAVEYAATDADVVTGPSVVGVMALADSSVVIRVVATTISMSQWKVERNLRLAIKRKFDEEGIEIPYPRRVLEYRSKLKGEDSRG